MYNKAIISKSSRSQDSQTLLHLSCLVDLVGAVAHIAVKVAASLEGGCVWTHNSPNSIVNTKF